VSFGTGGGWRRGAGGEVKTRGNHDVDVGGKRGFAGEERETNMRL
jgi:hypothetical protein